MSPDLEKYWIFIISFNSLNHADSKQGFKVFDTTTYQDGYDWCKENTTMKIATPHEILDFVKHIPKGTLLLQEGFCIPVVRRDTYRWKWMDGTELGSKDPKTFEGKDCGIVWLDNQHIDGMTCDTSLPFICQGQLVNPPEKAHKIIAYGTEFWLFKDKKPWEKARDICKKHGTELAVLSDHLSNILSLTEFTHTLSAVCNTSLVWLGLFRHTWHFQVGITEYKDIDNYNWCKGEPPTDTKNTGAMMIKPDSGGAPCWKVVAANSNCNTLCVSKDNPRSEKIFNVRPNKKSDDYVPAEMYEIKVMVFLIMLVLILRYVVWNLVKVAIRYKKKKKNCHSGEEGTEAAFPLNNTSNGGTGTLQREC